MQTVPWRLPFSRRKAEKGSPSTRRRDRNRGGARLGGGTEEAAMGSTGKSWEGFMEEEGRGRCVVAEEVEKLETKAKGSHPRVGTLLGRGLILKSLTYVLGALLFEKGHS